MTDHHIKRTPSAHTGGYSLTRLNALKHGALSKAPLLPWENPAEFDALHADLVGEFRAATPIERAQVEDLFGIMWRLRRLQLGERAVHAAAMARVIRASEEGPDETARVALVNLIPNFAGHETARALRASAEETAKEFHDLEASEYNLGEALKILSENLPDAYDKALSIADSEIKKEWFRARSFNMAEKALSYLPDFDRFKWFLEHEMTINLKHRRIILENRGLIRDQAIGEALASCMGELEKLARHEVHLRRRFEKTLAILVRLQELRGQSPNASVLQNLLEPPPADSGGEPREPSGSGGG
jgi:hypothetical protein